MAEEKFPRTLGWLRAMLAGGGAAILASAVCAALTGLKDDNVAKVAAGGAGLMVFALCMPVGKREGTEVESKR